MVIFRKVKVLQQPPILCSTPEPAGRGCGRLRACWDTAHRAPCEDDPTGALLPPEHPLGSRGTHTGPLGPPRYSEYSASMGACLSLHDLRRDGAIPLTSQPALVHVFALLPPRAALPFEWALLLCGAYFGAHSHSVVPGYSQRRFHAAVGLLSVVVTAELTVCSSGETAATACRAHALVVAHTFPTASVCSVVLWTRA